MAIVVGLELRRWNIVTATPDVYLVIAVFRRGFGFVESLQRAIVTFVKAPVAHYGNPHEIHLVQDMPERANGTFQYGRVGDVEIVTQSGTFDLLLDLDGFARGEGTSVGGALIASVVNVNTNVDFDASVDLEWYRRKRDLLYESLISYGYRLNKPGGAFYMFPQAPGGDDVAFCQAMAKKRVLVVPGSGFGTPGFFRLSYSVQDHVVEGSLPAFESAIREFR